MTSRLSNHRLHDCSLIRFDRTGIITFTYRRILQPHLPAWIPVVGGWTANEKVVNHTAVLHVNPGGTGKAMFVTKSGELKDPDFIGLSGLT